MARVAVVRGEFARDGRDYKKGEIIADPEMLAYLEGHDHEAHVAYTDMPDDHHAVAPHVASPEPEPEAPAKKRSATEA